MEDYPLKKETFTHHYFPTTPKTNLWSSVQLLFGGEEGIPTDLSHLYLNESGGSWANLGFWEETDDYSTACEDLAEHLGRVAGLNQNSKILDIGFGCGDQFRIWENLFEVSPKNITALNISKTQLEYAKSKYKDKTSSPDLILGSLEKLEEFENESFDIVLGLDSLYFIPNRELLISEVYRILKKGGAFVSAEILFADRKISFWESWKRSLIVRMARMSPDLKNVEEIVSDYSVLGFNFEVLERIDPFVFPGFSEFILSKIRSDKKIPKRLANRYKMLGEYFGSETIKKHFEYWIYKVRKPESQPIV
ncbi:class I SAM-dependent methyltransferase [Leptospira sarikeiensis]|uniref:Class I SAM-dependent methyltransferase n=1 Tax=Leptospira sarikeiensis TaxID=2484943 RepID=A0A4R9KDY0_9LEPT|nr:class I SAM-dependent methyltransferase [Leptospira sarikeiensis]TGL63392.1 class I SAM-dependent methyltransferase [Leptospira sarikeiensis]